MHCSLSRTLSPSCPLLQGAAQAEQNSEEASASHAVEGTALGRAADACAGARAADQVAGKH